MKDHGKMSDFEICGYVSMHENGFSWIEFDDEMASHVKCGNEGSPGFAIVEVKDYCNNPSYAWPLIDSNLICLMADVFCEPQDGGKWIAQPAYGWQHERVRNDNPLRAAMIVYLMMKDGEK